MLVSICIAVYNAEKSIRSTLESIKNQTYQDFEVIIVDDHSTDSTTRIIYNEFCARDDRFKLFINCTKNKYVDAHNKSYELANGEYLFRIDSDVVLLPDYLQYHIDFLNENINIDAVSSCCDLAVVTNSLTTIIELPESYKFATSDDEITGFNDNNAMSMVGNTVLWSNCTSVIRKDFYDKYSPKYISYCMGDIIFWWDVLSKGGKLYKLKEVKSIHCDYGNQFAKTDDYWILPYHIAAILSGHKEKTFKLQNNIEYENRFKKERCDLEDLATNNA